MDLLEDPWKRKHMETSWDWNIVGSRSLLVTCTKQRSAEVCLDRWSVVCRDEHWGWKPLWYGIIYVPNSDDLEKQWSNLEPREVPGLYMLNLFQCRKCVTLVKRFPLDSLAELWAIVIRRVVLRMVGWSQSSHPWTFIVSIFCEAQLKDPPNTWIINSACLLGSHQLTMESYADNFSTRGFC